MFVLIKIRWLQVKRELIQLGVLYSLIVGAGLAVLLFLSYTFINQPQYSMYVMIGIVATILSIHLNRKDISFINKQVPLPIANIFFEYLILCLPFILMMIFSAKALLVFPLLLSLILVSLIKTKNTYRTALPFLSAIVKPLSTEWLSGIRRNQWVIIPCYLATIATLGFKIVPLVFIWVMTATITSFYVECESKQEFYLFSSAKQLFWFKIKSALLLYSKYVLPLLIINSCINTDAILINLIFFISQLILILLAVALKYSMFTPNSILSGNNVIMSIAVIASAIPFLFPVPLLMAIRSYRKALSNLSTYYYD